MTDPQRPPEQPEGQDPDAPVEHRDDAPDAGQNRRPGGEVR